MRARMSFHENASICAIVLLLRQPQGSVLFLTKKFSHNNQLLDIEAIELQRSLVLRHHLSVEIELQTSTVLFLDA
jgi:hypothetical protein